MRSLGTKSLLAFVAMTMFGCALNSEGGMSVGADASVRDSSGDTKVTEPGIDVARPDVACFPPNKTCGDTCADFDDPDYGCAPLPACSPCEKRPNGEMACSNYECVIGACESHYWNCNGDPGDGCEIDLWSVDHCGACGQPCSLPHADPTCEAGSCAVSACHPGWGDCDNGAVNGCETDLRTLADCGQCGTPCTVTNGQPTCVTGSCLVNDCDPGRADCNGDPADGCETDLHSPFNCGACNRPCLLPNAGGTCTTGTCQIALCNPGFGDCNNNPADGCETNIRDSVDNCGACNAPCSGDHTIGRACSLGQCVPTCKSGWQDCNGPSHGNDDGCERDVYSPDNCGGCDVVCDPPHSSGACPLGTCAIATCDPSWDDCDGQLLNGCEKNVSSDVTNCGACGYACPDRPHADRSCDSGSCAIACHVGWGDCDGQATNGCETDIDTSPLHCGSCGTSCQNVPHASSECSNGSCVFTCDAGWDDCNTSAADGCESDLGTPAHCGTCANACPQRPHATSSCTSGTCGFTCVSGWADCNGQAVDGCETNLSLPATCGTCTKACTTPAHATPTCSAGTCGFNCVSGWSDCNAVAADGCETDLSLPSHCGGCSTVCTVGAHGTPACDGTSCGITCDGGWANCNTQLADGCESDLTLPTHCGSCLKLCLAAAHSTATCSGGTCGFACVANWGDCNGQATDGCERDLTQPATCGSCTNACTAPAHAHATCTAGACGYACDAGWGDCNGLATDGCETDLNTPTTCGSCTGACPVPAHAQPTCASGQCGFTCSASWGDCNAQAADGCETDLTSAPTHCGTCATSCPEPSNTVATCTTSTCGWACLSGYQDCNTLPSDGCEADLNSAATCGSCTNSCTAPANAVAVCFTGSCGFSCSLGFGNCNGDPVDGCEINLATDPLHCGSCTIVCGAGGPGTEPSCVNGQCGSKCAVGMEDCNGNLTDGCECGTGCCSDAGACAC